MRSMDARWGASTDHIWASYTAPVTVMLAPPGLSSICGYPVRPVNHSTSHLHILGWSGFPQQKFKAGLSSHKLHVLIPPNPLANFTLKTSQCCCLARLFFFPSEFSLSKRFSLPGKVKSKHSCSTLLWSMSRMFASDEYNWPFETRGRHSGKPGRLRWIKLNQKKAWDDHLDSSCYTTLLSASNGAIIIIIIIIINNNNNNRFAVVPPKKMRCCIGSFGLASGSTARNDSCDNGAVPWVRHDSLEDTPDTYVYIHVNDTYNVYIWYEIRKCM